MPTADRLVPDRPFPAYSFVPGKAPHPHSDPAGHSHGAPPPAVAPLDPGRWQESQDYLFAFDLFNGGFFWEAHEQLEGLWVAAGRIGPVAAFLKALIKLAAAGVKQREGIQQGVRSHTRRAAELLREVESSLQAGEDSFLGFQLSHLIALAEAIARDGWPEPAPVLCPSLPRRA